jgi:hypothetical protein
MKPINVFPIEDFLDKARIAKKSGQKTLALTAKEYNDLYDSISMAMTRLTGKLDQTLSAIVETKVPDKIEIKMDGGNF